MTFLDKVKKYFETVESPKYQIVHDPKLGYLPCYMYGIHGWCAIERHATIGISLSSASRYPELWVDTEAKAGERINLHATNRGQAIIWKG